MKFVSSILSIFTLAVVSSRKIYHKKNSVINGCITFTIGEGTGCSWMCNYCANTLGTNNYYFTDGVCTYEQGVGCVGSPISGKSYTCCSV
jgi:hypothetical protein